MKIQYILSLTVSLILMFSLVSEAQKSADYSADLEQLHANVWSDILKMPLKMTMSGK